MSSISAQDWKSRHQFAKSYYGISNSLVPYISNGSFTDSNEEPQQFQRSGFITPSINIGATHFWGYADFFISISTASIKFKDDKIENSLRLGTFTGLRLYPLPTRPNTVRPYLGYRFSPFSYKQKNLSEEDFRYTQVKSVFDIGVGIQLENFYLTFDYGRVMNSSFTTYLSRATSGTDNFPKHLFQIGLNLTIETTANADTELNRKANALFSQSNKKGFFVGVGISSAFPTVSSNYITDNYPFLDDKSLPGIFPDITIGYHYTKNDIVTSLSYRPIRQERNAYGFKQQVKRNSLVAETYKFLGDYHGFAPYIGVGLGFENIEVNEVDNGFEITNYQENKISPAILLGWDIRPSEKGDWWVLRTNLRYSPFLNLDFDSKKLSLQHLEFNFIQFIFYPQRLKLTKDNS